MEKQTTFNKELFDKAQSDGKFVVVQTEGCYQHRMTVDKKKLKRL